MGIACSGEEQCNVGVRGGCSQTAQVDECVDLICGRVDKNVGQAEVAMTHDLLGALLGESIRQFTLDLLEDLRRWGVLQGLRKKLDDHAALCHAGTGKGHHLL